MLLALCGIWAGCGKQAAPSSQIFNQAAPEIKAAWEKASAADKANDYVTAVTGYRNLALQRDKLTHEQLVTVNDALLAINQRLSEAYNQGEPAAKQAYSKLFQNRN